MARRQGFQLHRFAGSLTVAGLLCCAGVAARAADSYDGSTLSIPVMMVGDATYSNVQVTVGQIVRGPTGGSPDATADSYSPATGYLTVPAVLYGGHTYYNVVVSVRSLLSIGSVSGADSYASSRLTIAAVQVGTPVFQDVVLAVTPADVVSIGGGMPQATLDQFIAPAGKLLIPAVQVGSKVYTNVTLTAAIADLVSFGGSEPATPAISQVTAPGQISGLTVSPTGVPYFLDQTNSAVGYINAQGSPAEYGNLGPTPAPIEGVFGSGGFAGPAVGSDGNVYFPFNYANAIGQINPATGAFNQFPIPTASAAPFSIVLAPDGALWFTEFAAGQIGRLAKSGEITEFALPSGTAAMPTQIVVGPDGALWFPETGSGKIGRIALTATTANPQVTEFPMSYPGCISAGIASGPLNSLWYVGCAGSVSTFTIDQVSLSGEQVIYLFPAAEAYADPRFLTVGNDGALWISDQNANYIDRLVPAGYGIGSWTQYAYPLVHQGCCGNASGNWIFGAPDGSLWWTQFNTGNVGHLVP